MRAPHGWGVHDLTRCARPRGVSPWPWLAAGAVLFVVWRVVVWVTDALAAAATALTAAWPWLLAAALIPVVLYVALVAAAWWSIRDLPERRAPERVRLLRLGEREVARTPAPVARLEERRRRALPEATARPPHLQLVPDPDEERVR